MKTAKRLLSVLLVFVMIAATVACSGGSSVTEDGNTTTATQTEGSTGVCVLPGTQVPETPGIVDVEGWIQAPPDPYLSEFDGGNFIIIQHESEESPFGYEEDSVFLPSVLNRIEEMETKYGCTVSFRTLAYGGSSFVADFCALEFSGVGGDLLFSSDNSAARRLVGKGGEDSMLINLYALDNYLNVWDTDKWGTVASRETMMVGERIYGLTPALWVDCTPLPDYQLVYSRDVLAAFDLVDPAEYWENKAWDREAMLDLITSVYDDSGDYLVYGINAAVDHMQRASFLASGVSTVVVDRINADESVDWSYGLMTPEGKDALIWFKNAFKQNRKYFNSGKLAPEGSVETYHQALVEGKAAFCLVRGRDVVESVFVDLPNFGLTCWAGLDANVLSGSYDNCYSVSIPVFAQNPYGSALLMYDLFEGLDGMQDYDDVLRYYRETYFKTYADAKMLLRKNGNLQYSYQLHGGNKVWETLAEKIVLSPYVIPVIENSIGTFASVAKENALPNKVALLQYWGAGYFN